MKKLIIVCSGGFGKEALDLAQQMNEITPQWDIQGFIDDTKEIGIEIFRGYKILGSIKEWQIKDDEYFALGISKPKPKEFLYNLLKSRGAKFATLVKPATRIPPETIIGEGCVISGSIGLNVRLGICVNIAGSMVGGSEIGDFSTTLGFANVAGAKLGKRVYVGSHAVVLNGKRVGDDVTIAAGSIVFSNVKAGKTVFGNPAKYIEI